MADDTDRLGLALFLVSLGATAVVPLIQDSRWGRRVLATVACIFFAGAAYLMAGSWVADRLTLGEWRWVSRFPSEARVIIAVAVSLVLLVVAVFPARLLVQRLRELLDRSADALYRGVAARLSEEMGRREALDAVRREAEQRTTEPSYRIRSGGAGRSKSLRSIAKQSGESILPHIKELERHDLTRLARELDEQSISGLARKLRDGDLG